MNKQLANLLILMCYGCLLLPQSTPALRIKRAFSLSNATSADNNNIDKNSEIGNITATPIAAVPLALKPIEVRQTGTGTALTTASVAAAASATPAPIEAATVAAASTAASPEQKQQQKQPESDDLPARLFRGKRRPSAVEESLLAKNSRHGHRHSMGTAATAAVPAAAVGVAIATPQSAPPYVYYNKLVSPDGKQELKEFQLLAPNMVIESVQHDMNYGPSADMGGVLLLNADNNLNGRLRAPKHHHKHKTPLALPPFLFMLQQMLQPSLNMNLELEPQQPQQPPVPQLPRSRMDTPLYQFLDSAVDNALRNNHEVYEHLINERERDPDLAEKKEKDGDTIDLLVEHKSPTSIELSPNHKEDELIVTCPIHHERHANNNGEIVDDDVVLVNECHIA